MPIIYNRKVTEENFPKIKQLILAFPPKTWREKSNLGKRFDISAITVSFIEKAESYEQYIEASRKRKKEKRAKLGGNSFRKAIHKFYKETGFSQTKIAQLLKITQPRVSAIMLGYTKSRKSEREQFEELNRRQMEMPFPVPMKPTVLVNRVVLEPEEKLYAISSRLGSKNQMLAIIAALEEKGELRPGCKLLEVRRVIPFTLTKRVVAEEA